MGKREVGFSLGKEFVMANLRVGDVVQLKSGGPEMTILRVYDEYAECQWFMAGELKTGNFAVLSLVPVSS